MKAVVFLSSFLFLSVHAMHNTFLATVSNAVKSIHSHHTNTATHTTATGHYPTFHTSPTKKPICPNPNDASAAFEFDLSAELEALYPSQLIADALQAYPNLAVVIAQEIPIQSGLELVIPADLPFDTAELKCERTVSTIWTFKSAQGRGICWVLQGFQDPVLAIDCVNPICKGCNKKTESHSTWFNSAFNDDFWTSLNIPNFHSPYFGYHLAPTYKHICAPQFDVKTIWAFCPLSTDVQKIVREQIIHPVGCSCKRVMCPVV